MPWQKMSKRADIKPRCTKTDGRWERVVLFRDGGGRTSMPGQTPEITLGTAISKQPWPPHKTVHKAMINRVWKSCRAALPVLGSCRSLKQAAKRFNVNLPGAFDTQGVESPRLESGKRFCHRQANPTCGSPGRHQHSS